MKVSVIIPAYQAENYLIRCVNSILNQTLKEIEIIIVNDGSTDQTKNIAHQLQQLSSQITVIYQENSGAMIARNTGLAIATGEYILFVDADDWLDPKALEVLYIIGKKEEADIILFDAYVVVNNLAYPFKMIKSNLNTIHEDQLKAFFEIAFYPALWSKLIKRSYLEKNDFNFSLSASIGEDVAITAYLMMYNPTIACCHQHLYFYEQHKESLSHVISEKQLELFDSLSFLGDMLKENHLYEKYKQDYLNFATKHMKLLYQKLNNNPLLKQKTEQKYFEWIQKYN